MSSIIIVLVLLLMILKHDGTKAYFMQQRQGRSIHERSKYGGLWGHAGCNHAEDPVVQGHSERNRQGVARE